MSTQAVAPTQNSRAGNAQTDLYRNRKFLAQDAKRGSNRAKLLAAMQEMRDGIMANLGPMDGPNWQQIRNLPVFDENDSDSNLETKLAEMKRNYARYLPGEVNKTAVTKAPTVSNAPQARAEQNLLPSLPNNASRDGMPAGSRQVPRPKNPVMLPSRDDPQGLKSNWYELPTNPQTGNAVISGPSPQQATAPAGAFDGLAPQQGAPNVIGPVAPQPGNPNFVGPMQSVPQPPAQPSGGVSAPLDSLRSMEQSMQGAGWNVQGLQQDGAGYSVAGEIDKRTGQPRRIMVQPTGDMVRRNYEQRMGISQMGTQARPGQRFSEKGQAIMDRTPSHTVSAAANSGQVISGQKRMPNGDLVEDAIQLPGADRPTSVVEYDPRFDQTRRALTPQEFAGAGVPQNASRALAINPKYQVKDAQGNPVGPTVAYAGPTAASHSAWQQQVMTQYPRVGQAGTPENQAFVDAYGKAGAGANGMQIANNLFGGQKPVLAPYANSTQTASSLVNNQPGSVQQQAVPNIPRGAMPSTGAAPTQGAGTIPKAGDPNFIGPSPLDTLATAAEAQSAAGVQQQVAQSEEERKKRAAAAALATKAAADQKRLDLAKNPPNYGGEYGAFGN